MPRLRLLALPLLVIYFLFFVVPTPVLAQAPPTPIPLPRGVWFNPSYDEFRTRVVDTQPYEQVFGERYTFAQVVWLIHSIAIILQDTANADTLQSLRNFFSSAPSPLADTSRFGLPGLVAGSMAYFSAYPPASGLRESGRFLAKFDLATPASAQGYGYSASDALLPIWAAMRNSAYLVMVILLVAAGFMIMFRVKISPQASVTLQLMIPKIVITLIAVTFSFAIAGFIIDLVYLTVTFTIASFSATSGGIVNNLSNAINFFASPGQFEKLFIYYLLPTLIIVIVGLASGPLTGGLGVLAGLIAAIFFIITLILLIRVWWMLLKNYITLLFIIILGPWQIMLGLLPTSSGFTGWLRNLTAHAAVFAVVPLMFMLNIALWFNPIDSNLASLPADLATLLAGYGDPGINPIDYTAGQYPSFPLFSAQGLFFAMFASWAIMALIPKAADMVRDALKVPAFKYGTAFGEPLTPITGPAGASLISKGKANLAGSGWGTKIAGGVQTALGQAIQKGP